MSTCVSSALPFRASHRGRHYHRSFLRGWRFPGAARPLRISHGGPDFWTVMIYQVSILNIMTRPGDIEIWEALSFISHSHGGSCVFLFTRRGVDPLIRRSSPRQVWDWRWAFRLPYSSHQLASQIPAIATFQDSERPTSPELCSPESKRAPTQCNKSPSIPCCFNLILEWSRFVGSRISDNLQLRSSPGYEVWTKNSCCKNDHLLPSACCKESTQPRIIPLVILQRTGPLQAGDGGNVYQ